MKLPRPISPKRTSQSCSPQAKIGVLITLMMCSNYAFPQMKSGTVIVTLYSSNTVVLAADSRSSFIGTNKPSVDNECKLFALDKDLIAGIAGIVGPASGLGDDSHSLLKREFSRLTAKGSDRVQALAMAWGDAMSAMFNEDLARPNSALYAIFRNAMSEQLASAVFAGTDKSGNLLVFAELLTCHCSSSNRYAEAVTGQVGMAHNGLPNGVIGDIVKAMPVFFDLQRSTSPRKFKDAASVAVYFTQQIIKRANDPGIGGPVDAIELPKGGIYRWIKRKPNCRDNP